MRSRFAMLLMLRMVAACVSPSVPRRHASTSAYMPSASASRPWPSSTEAKLSSASCVASASPPSSSRLPASASRSVCAASASWPHLQSVWPSQTRASSVSAARAPSAARQPSAYSRANGSAPRASPSRMTSMRTTARSSFDVPRSAVGSRPSAPLATSRSHARSRSQTAALSARTPSPAWCTGYKFGGRERAAVSQRATWYI